MIGERTLQDTTIADIDAGLPAVEIALADGAKFETRIAALYVRHALLKRRFGLVMAMVEAGTHHRVMMVSALGVTTIEAVGIESPVAGTERPVMVDPLAAELDSLVRTELVPAAAA